MILGSDGKAIQVVHMLCLTCMAAGISAPDTSDGRVQMAFATTAVPVIKIGPLRAVEPSTQCTWPWGAAARAPGLCRALL